MGDAADSILDGTVCQHCGGLMPYATGFAQACVSCSDDQLEDEEGDLQPPEGWDFADEPHPTERVGKLFRLDVDRKGVEFWHELKARDINIRPGETGEEAYLRERGKRIPFAVDVCWRRTPRA
jgi:hypothetical protein